MPWKVVAPRVVRCGWRCVQESQSRLESVIEANARATAKAVVRKAAARAERRALSEAQESGDESREQQQQREAHAQEEERMGTLISSLVALASASGVSQERALFMEVANGAVQSELTKLSQPGGAGAACVTACAQTDSRFGACMYKLYVLLRCNTAE